MHLERYQVDDLLLIEPALPQRYPGFLNALNSDRGPALTLWHGNVALGAAGITRWKLCDEAWVYLSSELLLKYPLLLHRMILTHMPFFAKILRTRDLVARIQPGYPKHARWPEAFQMTFSYIDEDDFLVYTRRF